MDSTTRRYMVAWYKILEGSATNEQVSFVSDRLAKIVKLVVDSMLSESQNGPTSDAIKDITKDLLFQAIRTDLKTHHTLKDLINNVFEAKNNEDMRTALQEMHAFIHQCLTNKAIDLIKSKDAVIASLDAPATQSDNEDGGATLANTIPNKGPSLEESVVNRISLQSALSLLNESKREIVELHVVQQLSLAEIAKQQKKNEASVRTTYYRAVAELRQILKNPDVGWTTM